MKLLLVPTEAASGKCLFVQPARNRTLADLNVLPPLAWFSYEDRQLERVSQHPRNVPEWAG